MNKFLLLPLTLFFLLSCKRSDNSPGPEQPPTGKVSVHLEHKVNDEDLVLRHTVYSNAWGEPFNVEELKYFVSNFKFIQEDGTEYVVPQDSCYFLVDVKKPETLSLDLPVAPGTYMRMEFIIGVDSLRSTMDIDRRTGVLDPASGMDDGMYWGWNSGYIFFKMEGLSEVAPPDGLGQPRYRYHIGGFGGYDIPTINNIRKVNLDLQPKGPVYVNQGKVSSLIVKVDVAKVFDGVHHVSIAEMPNVMFSEFSLKVSENYTYMFSHEATVGE